MTKQRSSIALFLILAMLLSALASCGGTPADQTEAESENSTESTQSTEGETTIQGGDTDTETYQGADTESEPQDTEAVTDAPVELTGEHAELIEYADLSANGINAYFSDAKRTAFVLENREMLLTYSLPSYSDQQIASLTDLQGNPYIQNTSDVFVKMKDGSIYYASNSTKSTSANLYRLGYYYYEARFEEQLFCADVSDRESTALGLEGHTKVDLKSRMSEDGNILINLTSASKDPYIVLNKVNFSAEDYGYIKITIKADTRIPRSFQFFLKAGGNTGFSEAQSKGFTVSPSEDFQTYYVPIFGISNYTGRVTSLRLDFGGEANDSYEIKEISIVKGIGDNATSALGLNRSFLVYPDKLHHFLQVSSADISTEGIDSIGLMTRIHADTVDKLVIKDGKGLHTSLDGIDHATVEYVAFDIKNAGIFGYILPADNSGGTLTVTLTDGIYTLTQSRAPENGTVNPSGIYNSSTKKIDPVVPLNGNDFFMGQRLYTDQTHTFDAFLTEAEQERNPLGADNFVIDTKNSANATFEGYDAIRGIYTFDVDSAGFNGPYFQYPNKYYNVKFTVKGGEEDRKIYVLSSSDSTGCLECAVLLDGREMLLPIPIQVGKNFSEAKLERNRWNIDDAMYCEAILPLVVNAGEEYSYTIANLYQNWGQFPLKQISWIQASAVQPSPLCVARLKP